MNPHPTIREAARQGVAPRTKPTQPTKPSGRAIGGGTGTEKGVLSASSVLSGAVRRVPETSGAMSPDPELIRDLLEERAAIREYDGGHPRSASGSRRGGREQTTFTASRSTKT